MFYVQDDIVIDMVDFCPFNKNNIDEKFQRLKQRIEKAERFRAKYNKTKQYDRQKYSDWRWQAVYQTLGGFIYMDNLITLKIKATSFNRLINELKSLKDMYLDFSNNTDNIITGSFFHIIVKDLETLIAKYEYKKSPSH